MIGWVLAAVLTLHPEMAAREAELGALVDAVARASETREDAALLVAIGWWESGRTFRADLEGDGHESVSTFQIRVCRRGDGRCARAKVDLAFAAAIALGMAKASIVRCRRVPAADALSEYTTGRCQPNREARTRLATARWLIANVAPPAGDDS